MRRSSIAFFVLMWIFTILVVWDRAEAHHSWTTDYDTSQSFRLEGTVRKFEFASPHSFLDIDVIDVEGGDGSATTWKVELHSATVLTRMGFRMGTFEYGDRVMVNAWPNRDPEVPEVYGIGVITADGAPLGDSPPINDAGSFRTTR